MELVERIKKLCQERGITLNQLEKAIGLKGTIARWADHDPAIGKVQMVAQYFGVPISQLTGEEPMIPTITPSMEDIMETLRERPDMRILFKTSKNATPEAVMKVAELLKAFEHDDTD